MKLFKTKKRWNHCLIIIAIGLQLYSTHCKPGITYDSRQYLSTAHSFAQSRQLLNEKGIPHLAHTPLYAIILSGLGPNRMQLSKYLHTVCLIITLWCFIYLANQVLQSVYFQWLFAILLATATPLQLIHHFVWSEPVFLAFLAILLVLCYWWLSHPTSPLFWGMILAGFFLCLQRNPGIFVILGMALGLWWFTKTKRWRIAVFVMLSISGWLAWTAYTFQTNQSDIQPAFHNLLREITTRHNLDHHLNVLSSWWMPLTIPLIVRGPGWLALMIALVGSGMYRRIRLSQFTKILSIICFVYIICLQFTERVDYHETTRYLTVIFPLAMLVIFSVIELVFRHLSVNIAQTFKWLLLFWMFYPMSRTWKNVATWHQIRCKEKPTIIEIREDARNSLPIKASNFVDR